MKAGNKFLCHFGLHKWGAWRKFSYPLQWWLRECSRCGKFLSVGNIEYKDIDYTDNESMKIFLREARMKAGRELDYLIAEKVFDLTCLHDPPTGILLPVDLQVKNYSTRIQDAWLVVEKLVETESYRVELFCGYSVFGNYKCSIFCSGKWVEFTADTAPLAICLAALKATEERGK